jgi:hypothetical protein
VSVSISTREVSVGKECLQADLDTAVGADASSLDPKVARGGGGHMGGAPAAGDPTHCIEGACLH